MAYNITNLTTAVSSIAGPSSPIVLNWRSGQPVAWRVTVSSSIAVGDWQLQSTTDDIQLTTNSSIYPPSGVVTGLPSSIAVWSALSSTPYLTVSATGSIGLHFGSSNCFPDGVSGAFLAPPAALRLFSTSLSSHVVTLAVIQGD
jgi:hypothetical protein